MKKRKRMKDNERYITDQLKQQKQVICWEKKRGLGGENVQRTWFVDWRDRDKSERENLKFKSD